MCPGRQGSTSTETRGCHRVSTVHVVSGCTCLNQSLWELCEFCFFFPMQENYKHSFDTILGVYTA